MEYNYSKPKDFVSKTDAVEFSGWRAYFWPVHRYELKKLLPLLLILFLISFDYNVLRTLKDTLVVTAKKSGAEVIPFIKVWVMFPGSIFMTWLFTRLSNRLSREAVFYVMVGLFIGYFAAFAAFLYPHREELHPHAFADSLQAVLPLGLKGFIAMIRNWTFTSFYVMSELWGNIVMFVLFWGFANQITKIGEARRFYAILGVATNASGIIAGELSVLASQGVGESAWESSMTVLITMVTIAGLLSLVVFRWMNCYVLQEEILEEKKEQAVRGRISMRENFAYLFNSRYLLNIAVIVIAYNIVINLVEVLWKHQVRELYPDPSAFNLYMNQVMVWIGVIATFASLMVTGNVIRLFGWTFTAMLTPVILLITSVGFFGFFFFQDYLYEFAVSLTGMAPLAIVVFFGTLQNCLSRGAKYTIYDATKEMSFVPLSSQCKIKGKAAIDGVCNRLGKSGGSFIHQSLLIVFSTLTASAPYVALILFGVIAAWMGSVSSLGRQFNALSGTKETPNQEVAEPQVA